jgi:hypothetical protein
MLTPGEILGTIIAAGLTLMMFSFIYKDNVLFKLGEHLYLGVSVGYYLTVNYWNVIYPDVIRETTINNHPIVLLPAVLGLLILLRLVPKIAWLSRLSFAFYIGGFAGLAVPNAVQGQLLPQLFETLRPFEGSVWVTLATMALLLAFFALLGHAVHTGNKVFGLISVALLILSGLLLYFHKLPGATAVQIIILVGVFTVLIFFFFSLEHKGAIGSISRVGLFFIMISFGASFGYTVMARISLLIGRFQFLLDDVWKGLIVASLFGHH